ncbi:chromate resistance protein ChrB domain-containing protein [Yoonia sp. R2331]|uniref:chromate resistance protein ChrB domain-containing protein n=1 Tax=Yoonia sp. R2331 TaxID=3237238 RepID=UPI0034E433F4
MSGFQTISPAALMRRIGLPDCPKLIDLRIPEDLAENPVLIPGAFPHDFRNFDNLLKQVGGTPCVTICHAGHKISHGVAARLRAAGTSAEVLEGGMLAWLAEALPAIPMAAVPTLPDGTTRWVTRHRPKIDRIACAWLIRRFVDPRAEFLFVPPAEVTDVADRFTATPYDVPGVTFAHDGPLCTFDVMIRTFGLSHPALDRLAAVVRAADTDKMKGVPQAAGLLAISVGLSRQFKNDIDQLNAALPLYDALYRWARDGHTETHTTDAQAQP